MWVDEKTGAASQELGKSMLALIRELYPITRSITGHKTAAMQEHYTDKDAEQHRKAIEAAMATLYGRWSNAKAA